MNRGRRLIFIILLSLLVFPMRTFSQEEFGIGWGAVAVEGERVTEEEIIPPENIVEILQEIIPQPPGSSMTIIPGQNKLVVKNTRDNLKKIEDFLRELATPPQVAIEAKFVMVGEDTFKDLGLTWQFMEPIRLSDWGSGKPFGGGWGEIISATTTYGVTRPITDYSISEGGLNLTYTALKYPRFMAILHLLASRADTKFLSAPRITTMNNEPAIIRFIKTITYIEGVEIERTTDEDTGITTTTYDYTFADVDVGIILNVTPLVIQATRSVTLFLQPIVSDIEAFKSFVIERTGTVETTIEQPIFVSKDLSTNVTVYDGATIVLGGLMSEDTVRALSKVPVLGDVPVIGKAFFQRDTTANEKKHLLIFVTVNILSSQGTPLYSQK